jgi:tripartite-type tricarboxylate transporter receptor subunit TctC
MILVNHIYNIAKPDGLTIATFNRGLPCAQLLKAEGVKFDLTKCSWVGSTAAEATVLTLRSDLPYRSLDDLRKAKEPVYLGCTGTGDSSTQFPVLLKEFVKLRLEIVDYPSSAAAMLAVERKEVHGRAGSYTSLVPYIERGLVHPIIRGRVSEPKIEILPVDEELTSNQLGKTIMSMRSSMDMVGRPYLCAPGTPIETMNILRDSFARVAKDPELKEDAKKNKMDVEYFHADECLKIIRYLFSQPDDIVKEFGKYVRF